MLQPNTGMVHLVKNVKMVGQQGEKRLLVPALLNGRGLIVAYVICKEKGLQKAVLVRLDMKKLQGNVLQRANIRLGIF